MQTCMSLDWQIGLHVSLETLLQQQKKILFGPLGGKLLMMY